MKFPILGSAVVAAILSTACGAVAAEAGPSAMFGALECEKTGTGTTFVVHSRIPVSCVYRGLNGEHSYVGTTGILIGADLEIEEKMMFSYLVVGGADVSHGGLAGKYVGAKASATAGVGVAAQAGLVGVGPHSFTLVPLGLGVQVGIGASAGIGYLDIEAVPAKVVAVPPLPAPPPVAMITDRSMAFFDFDRSVLTPEGSRIVSDMASAYRTHGGRKVTVVGHGDTVGTRVYNYDLGMRRAESVKAALVASGVPAGAISTDSHGKYDLMVETADQVREAKNRRAVIVSTP
jgi:outer membrane protein OmpA-like peptidoglycan-associated protein